MIYPVVLGAGERLFGATADKKPVRLVDSRTVGDGIAILTYESVRGADRPTDGSLQDRRAAALRRAGIHERPGDEPAARADSETVSSSSYGV